MKVKELLKFLENVDQELDVCVLENAGQGYGELPFPIKPKVKEVITYDGVKKIFVIVN